MSQKYSRSTFTSTIDRCPMADKIGDRLSRTASVGDTDGADRAICEMQRHRQANRRHEQNKRTRIVARKVCRKECGGRALQEVARGPRELLWRQSNGQLHLLHYSVVGQRLLKYRGESYDAMMNVNHPTITTPKTIINTSAATGNFPSRYQNASQ